MFKKYSLPLILVFNLLIGRAYCDSQYIFQNNNDNDQQALSLNNSIVVNKTYPVFASVVEKLQELGFKTSIVSEPGIKLSNIYISSDTNIRDFVNIAATKFGYTWTNNNNNITFKAISPSAITQTTNVVPKPVIITRATPNSAQASVAAKTYNQWELSTKDRTLRTALMRWTHDAGWQLVWNSSADYPISTKWDVSGNFETALNKVLIATQHSDTPLYATMYDADKVVEIKSSFK